MKAPRTGAGFVIGLAAALALFVPAAAQGKGALATEADASPGITITGIGFARPGAVASASGEARESSTDAVNPTALARAVGDARRRAKGIAAALGVQVGATTEVDLRDIGQFARSRLCSSQAAKKLSQCQQPTLTAAAVTVTFEIVGAPDSAPAAGAVQAQGEASVAIEPTDPTRNQPIRKAVLSARQAATPQAAEAARRNAERAARAGGLGLGGVVSVSEVASTYYFGLLFGSSFYDPALGSFGPGQFCGYVWRPVIKRDPTTGQRRVVRRVCQRRCRPGSTYSVSLEVRYAAG